MQSHICKVHACLAVTCHLNFWQNDWDLLLATAVTQGWNGYRNMSHCRKLTPEKKIIPPFLQGFKPATFQSWVQRSNHWVIYCQCVVTDHFSAFWKQFLKQIGIKILFVWCLKEREKKVIPINDWICSEDVTQHTRACAHAYAHTHMHTHAHTCMHAHTHTHTHIPMHACTHTSTLSHMCIVSNLLAHPVKV